MNIGDVINVQVEELVLTADGKLTFGKPTALVPDLSRPAYTTSQIINLARRFGALKEEIGKDDDDEEWLISKVINNPTGVGGAPAETTNASGGYNEDGGE